MHIVILFVNIGSYHAARLKAAHAACESRGWTMTAIQVTDNTLQHPWGNLKKEITFPVETLLPIATTPLTDDVGANSVDAVPKLNSCLNQLCPHVVLVPGWGFPISRAALEWCRRNKVPAVLMSESKHDDEKRVWWKEVIKSHLYVRQFAAAIVGGQPHYKYIVRLGLAPERTFIGYDVVDNEYFMRASQAARDKPEEARRRQPNIPERPYFLSMTRFLPRKNLSRLIHAYKAYRQERSLEEAWDLVVCGAGEEESSIRQLIDENGLANRVHLPGFLPYDALPDWYGLTGAFIHPAIQEQWGLVLNEACASGLPILCSKTVGARYDLVNDGNNGFLFDPYSVGEITSVLLKMHHLGAQQRAEMGGQSWKIVAEFGPERFAEGVLKAVDVCTS
jgi:glycosyltransferase involved in cell wall biosynthesis